MGSSLTKIDFFWFFMETQYLKLSRGPKLDQGNLHVKIGTSREFQIFRAILSQTTQRPREINVHFSNFPEDDLERLSINDIESTFQMSVKEADQIRSKSQNIAQFQQQDWKRLWHAIVESDQSEYGEVGKQLTNRFTVINFPFSNRDFSCIN